MFNTLYKKLSVLLFSLIVVIGFMLFYIVSYSSEMYQQEVAQKLNLQLAEHIVHENLLLKDGEINQNALKDIFHMMMVINPSIELYLLDSNGKILAYSAPAEKIKRKTINLTPIIKYVAQNREVPLLGDDPRHADKQKVFSAATIINNGALQGYLYVILGGEIFDSITEMIRNSYILQVSLIGLGSALIIALLAGTLLFKLLTQRLTTLSSIISNYLTGAKDTQNLRYPTKQNYRDEIDELGENFNVMAQRIDKQLAELKQNDAKRRELVANVSHDLRTPLTSLHGYLQTLSLKEDSLSAQEKSKYLQIAINQSERLKDLISELFELAKLDSVETLLSIEPFSLGELAQDVTHKYSLIASDNGISLKTDFKQELPFVYGDIALIQRVLENLLDNALRHTQTGGEITLSLADNHGNIAVNISDTGCGIPKEEIEHIFDRFYQIDKSSDTNKNHSGLGLAITKKIISLHGSTIEANSTPNVGTTFTFHLPAYQAG